MVDIKKIGNISTVTMDGEEGMEFLKGMETGSLIGMFTSAAGQFLMLKHNILQVSRPCKEMADCTTTLAVAWCVNSCAKAVTAAYTELVKRDLEGKKVGEIEGIKALYEKCREGGYLDAEVSPEVVPQDEPVEGKDEIHEKKWKFGGYH